MDNRLKPAQRKAAINLRDNKNQKGSLSLDVSARPQKKTGSLNLGECFCHAKDYIALRYITYVTFHYKLFLLAVL